MAERLDYPHGVSALDSDLLRPQLAAIHLLRSGDRLALVDTGTSHSLPAVLDSIA
ncbi:MAG: MBL fold metallo-hydrolase, partial [Betaproteobacteria bacterium]|nr:MBL fold metallo-hydrolase [Betaproteobacteria bacterium]